MTFSDKLNHYKDRVEHALHTRLPQPKDSDTSLCSAMTYAVTNGGKRVRPVLTYATGEALGASLDVLDVPACAIEMVHAYSLVHDDLPAMDNDDLRRGKPTCHKKFDEATAILAGDALQAQAFTLIAEDQQLSPDIQIKMIRTLGQASGCEGMAQGQAIDLEAVGQTLTLAELELMHRHKTGALIRASVAMGAYAANETSNDIIDPLVKYASAIGLGFQIVDDILDVTSDTATLGKPQGSDIAQNKPTYPALLGLQGAREHAQQTHELALSYLQDFPESFDILRDLSRYILNRTF